MKTIAVIFGGQSTEHDVSIVTALASIIKPLELTGLYRVEAVYIAKDGRWFWDEKLKNIQLYQSGKIKNFMQKVAPTMLQFGQGLMLVKSSKFAGHKLHRKIDVVFPAMHGTHGEDGDLMGLLEMAGVPYVGCEVAASAIAMDKAFAKRIAVSHGIPTSKWVEFTSRELESPELIQQRVQSLIYPLFVKPTHIGSSIGISEVTEPTGLLNALEVAAHYDEKILVEEAVQNLVEVTLPIMGNQEPQPAFLEQPTLHNKDFFDFETKYLQGGKGASNSSGNSSGSGGQKGTQKGAQKGGAQGYSTIPAQISSQLYQKAESTGLAIYRALGCSGIARVDMLIDQKKGTVYFNEVNPLPGGLYAHNWRQKGISNVELVQRLVGYAEERFVQKQHLQRTFATNYLKQF